MNSTTEKISFQNKLGETLDARLELPQGTPQAYALFAHCFTCSKDILAATRISRALAAKKIAVLRFDFTGLGNSEGDFANTNFSMNVEDLVAASDFLRDQFEAPKLLIGHSLGGTAVLSAATHVPETVGVITIGAPSEPQHVKHLFKGKESTIESEGSSEVQLGGRTFKIKKQFLDDLAEHKTLEQVGGLRKALLIFHSPVDMTVDVENARKIYDAARHPKSFISLDKADHLLNRKEDSAYVAATIAAWAGRYLGTKASASPSFPSDIPEGAVVVREAGDKFLQEVSAGNHQFLADEPTKWGGTDQGPNPYDFLLASLGACTSMTLRGYANRKKWPLERVTISLSHEKIHAADCEACETKDGKVDQIERTITLEGPLSEEQKTRLLEIADRCPVHRTLESEIHVVTHLG